MQKISHKSRSTVKKLLQKVTAHKLAKISFLRQRLSQKRAELYADSLNEQDKKRLFNEVVKLHEQIDELEWQLMTPEQKARFRIAEESMWKKFESSAGGFVVVKQGQEIP